MSAPVSIARLQATLDEVEPPVRRVIDVPADIRLDRLHATLQAAFGWADYHLWEFRAGETGWGLPDPDWPDGPLDARKTTLWRALEDTGAGTLTYLYDFGDGWEHTIAVLRFDDAEPGAKYPVLVEATGRCPPEDVGGPWGYADFLDAIADPDHENHDDMTEWYGEGFDPQDVPLDGLRADVADLATRWNRKPRRRKTK